MVSNVSIVGAFMAVTAVYVILQALEFVQLSWTTPQQPDSVPAAETSSIVQEKEQQEKVQNPDKISDKQKKQVLDFAVAGFAKCGTSFLLHDVFGHPSSQDYIDMGKDAEINLLAKNQVDDFLQLYDASTERNKLNGYKSPIALEEETSLSNLEKYFPATKFIIGIRHPVWRFQSWYNFRVRQLKEDQLLHSPYHYVGYCHELCASSQVECIPKRANHTYAKVRGCTQDSSFQLYLSRLGLTPMDSKAELDLLQHHGMSIHRGFAQHKAQVFLYDVTQLEETDDYKHVNTLLQDLEGFLVLPKLALPRMGVEDDSEDDDDDDDAYDQREGMTEAKQSLLLNICDDEHLDLRQHLVEIGTQAATWIEDYFLQSPQVTVSNRLHFLQQLQSYKQDPCISESNTIPPQTETKEAEEL